MDRATIYFSHYLFEAYRLIGWPDCILDRMGLWFDLAANGFSTTPESPEPSRSDCHAWGAHPVFHYFSSILGMRPASAGFKAVRIEPQLGPLLWAKGAMPHPKGIIRVDVRMTHDILAGTIDLPDDTNGLLVQPSGTRILISGRNTI